MNIVESGDELISGGGIFGGTSSFFREMKHFGVRVNYVETDRVENFAKTICRSLSTARSRRRV